MTVTERGWVVWANQAGGSAEMRRWFEHHRQLKWADVWRRLQNPYWMLRVLENAGHRNEQAMLQIVVSIATALKDLVPDGWRTTARRARELAARKASGFPVGEAALEAALLPFFELRLAGGSPINTWAARASMLAVQLAHTQTLGVASIDWSDLARSIDEGCIAVRFAKTSTRTEWMTLVSQLIRRRIPKPPRIP